MTKFVVRMVLCSAFLSAGEICAADLTVPFLDGLRARRYFDTAIETLDRLQQAPGLSPKNRGLLLFQRALTLQQSAPFLQKPEDRILQVQTAERLYQQFLVQYPQQTSSAQARTQLGKIQFERICSQFWSTDLTDHSSQHDEFWREVRSDLQAVRVLFEDARNQYRAAWEQFPVYISEQHLQLRAARNRAEELLIRAELNLAQCHYYEAQTYPAGSDRRRLLLTQAGAEYEKIHQRYRSQVGGLYARIWQGKCYEELDNDRGLRLAMGIYNEILDHDGESPALRHLKDVAVRFRLICLNSKFRRDYQLVEQEAEDWLASAGERLETNAGWGIEWELCRCLEFMSQDDAWAPDTRHDYLQRAKQHAEHLAERSIEFKFVSKSMLKRIESRLDETSTSESQTGDK